MVTRPSWHTKPGRPPLAGVQCAVAASVPGHSHKEQASMIRRYIIWRNNHAYDERLRRIVAKANLA
jgi:hypothetical protein